MPENDDLNYTEYEPEEFDQAQTIHRRYEFGPEWDREDINDFIHSHARGGDEAVFIQQSYDRGRGEEWANSQGWDEESIDSAWEEIDDDLEAYGADATGSVSVVFVGGL